MPDNEDLYSYIHCKPAKNAKHRAQGEKKISVLNPYRFSQGSRIRIQPEI